MNSPIPDVISIGQALHTRMNKGARLGDRAKYIGASEIGNCLRRVALSKIQPRPFDLASMGRMLAGRAMENEVVQLVRIALNGRLRSTGRSQLDLRHPSLPFHAHPDGRIIGEFDGLVGDGILEVKTASSTTFKKCCEDGLPQIYLDQVQAQMGLAGFQWALVVLASRENLAELATFLVPFDPSHYSGLEERACSIMHVLTLNNIQKELPGEPERGFCHTCPYSHDCAAFQARREAGLRGEVPEVVRFQLEAQLEELASLESITEPAQERISELRDQVKEILLNCSANKVLLENGIVQLVDSSRTSFDSKSLQREAPETYTRFLKTSVFSTLRINHKGATTCQRTA